jgi:hypothetical protein
MGNTYTSSPAENAGIESELRSTYVSAASTRTVGAIHHFKTLMDATGSGASLTVLAFYLGRPPTLAVDVGIGILPRTVDFATTLLGQGRIVPRDESNDLFVDGALLGGGADTLGGWAATADVASINSSIHAARASPRQRAPG